MSPRTNLLLQQLRWTLSLVETDGLSEKEYFSLCYSLFSLLAPRPWRERFPRISSSFWRTIWVTETSVSTGARISQHQTSIPWPPMECGARTHPFCGPSRAALLSGRYQQRFGFENNPDDDANNPRLGIPSDELLIPQLLEPNGYVCGAIGKWHVGYATNLHPIARGFDSFYGFLSAQSDYFNPTQLLRDRRTSSRLNISQMDSRARQSRLSILTPPNRFSST